MLQGSDLIFIYRRVHPQDSRTSRIMIYFCSAFEPSWPSLNERDIEILKAGSEIEEKEKYGFVIEYMVFSGENHYSRGCLILSSG